MTQRLPHGRTVPSSRIARLARLGGLASGIAGGAMLEGARRLARGQDAPTPSLLLTPGNVARLTAELARMRGAAMKLGQLMSMDTGDLLPPELGAILARLRAEAHPMPPKQLRAVLVANWGADWLRRFARFEATPIAAASIGQVHRARTRDGRDLAVKVQYPGVRRSIDSDVANVGALIRLSGLLPREIDLAPILEEARRQLHEEADYLREADCLARFNALLDGAPGFALPVPAPDLTTPEVLAMGFVEGSPIEALADAPQALRDSVVARLAALTLRELFEFRLMQTDPNFANYLHDAAGDRVLLLDFGATREIPKPLAEGYRSLLRSGLAGDRAGVEAAARAIGLIGPGLAPRHLEGVLEMAELAFADLRLPGLYDVAGRDIAGRLRDAGLALGAEAELGHVPPADTLFVQRKFGGIYLLAHRLRARIDMAALLRPWL